MGPAVPLSDDRRLTHGDSGSWHCGLALLVAADRQATLDAATAPRTRVLQLTSTYPRADLR